mgnify:CR=1 FL=1
MSSHFYHYYGSSNTVKAVSIERLQRWSTWCQHGYSAKDIEKAIRPCYEQQVSQLKAKADGYTTIGYKKSREIKAFCTQQLWEQINPSPAL